MLSSSSSLFRIFVAHPDNRLATQVFQKNMCSHDNKKKTLLNIMIIKDTG